MTEAYLIVHHEEPLADEYDCIFVDKDLAYSFAKAGSLNEFYYREVITLPLHNDTIR